VRAQVSFEGDTAGIYPERSDQAVLKAQYLTSTATYWSLENGKFARTNP
jgi:hypothetical protein